MYCPLTNKICLMPKEIFVTEMHPDGVKHLFMCRECGEKYIEKLSNVDVVTKSLEVITNENGNVTTEEKIYEEPIPKEEAIIEQNQNEKDASHLEKLEQKLDNAITHEDYERASKLRDLIKDFKKKKNL